MRSLGLVGVLALSACGSDDGAILTFEAPDGPATASRIQIVLASADTETIGTGIRQRMQPGALGEEDVVYYRQRARGGVVERVTSLDGFEVRIEPELDTAPDEQFIPFALMFDDAGALVGVGAVHDPDGNPMPVTIREDQRILYPMTVTPVATPGGDTGLAVNQGLVVGCRDDHAGAWTSGVAWHPATGPQLRLLLADLAADPDSTDATDRMADLDCDAHDAADDDCDDLRDAYHAGQVETCDGLDTDCDGERMELQACDLANPSVCGGTGSALCVDEGANAAPTACLPAPDCACANQLGTCSRCVIDTRSGTGGGATRTACAPAIGKLHLYDACEGNCQVEVVATDGAFAALVGAADIGPFAVRTPSNGNLFIRVKQTNSTLPTPTDLTTVATIYLAVTTSLRTVAVNVDVAIPETSLGECRVATLADNYVMTCSP